IRRRGFMLAAAASLALGIAANTAVFSVVNTLLFKDVPGVRVSDRLVQITRDVDGEWYDLPFPVAQHLRTQSAILADVGVFAIAPASVVGDGEPTVRGALAVTASYFHVLGTKPGRGRLFLAEEATYPRAAPVALVTHDLWQREFRGDEALVGRTIRVNGFPLMVVGVLPHGFAGHQAGLLSDVFFPVGVTVPGAPNAGTLSDPESSVIEAIGLLQPGVSTTVAGKALSAAADQYAREHIPGHAAGAFTIRVDPWGPLPNAVRAAFITFRPCSATTRRWSCTC
ncbi:MAG: ABC transporter permease, partial [Acidobacteriota bacterium]